MQLNLSTDIALRTLIYLAQKDAPATIGEISEAFDIARTHLMKVAMTLVSCGLVSSERGRNGGLRLAQKAEDIRIGNVVELMEPDMALVFCLKADASNDDCPLMPSCKLRKVCAKAQKAMIATLNEATLADLLGSKAQSLIK